MKDLMRRFHQLIELERERSEMLKEIESVLGFDMSFSEEQIFKNAMDTFKQELDKEVVREITSWMK
jgi:hypothetical protein